MNEGSLNSDLKLLLCIEDLRKRLLQIVGEGKNLQDPQVIQVSQELDDLLNRYYKLTSSLLSK